MSKPQKKPFLLPPWTSPHPGRSEHFQSPLWFSFFIFSNSRPFCSSESPIYFSAEVKRRTQTPHPQSSISQRQSVFFWGGGGFSLKKDKSQLISSIMVTPTWGRDLGFFPRTGSCSSMHVEVQKRQWEMIYNVEKMVRHRDTMMSLTLSEKFKESLWWYVSSRRNVV